MNKTEKRQFDLRNKLIAAIAMLLVSCIMMVSTTYAWFTLSTAPEVQGITTTVGANGNLEIALSPSSGDANHITSGMGDANKPWAEKNLTWGNLLDLSDNSTYGLGDIKLLPAALNFTGATKDEFKLADFPLSTPSYGADGRPQALNDNTYFGSKNTNGTGFVVSTEKGIRVIGTSDNMSEWEAAFNAALADLSEAVDNSKTAAQNSLNDHGTVLAGIMVDYGLDSSNNKTYTATDVEHLGSMITKLETANAELLDAIKAALLAEAASERSFDEARYNDAKTLLASTATADNYATYYNQYGSTHHEYIAAAAGVYADVARDLGLARGEYDTVYADGNGTYTYATLSPVLNYLMNKTGVSVNGAAVTGSADDLKNQIAEDVAAGKGVNIILGEGSGVYATIAKATGNLGSTVPVPPVSVGGFDFTTLTANIVTSNEPVTGGYLPAVKLVLATAGAHVGDASDATQYINVSYGYVVDFFFRTNASASNLKLQTTPAQRVYSDSTSTATQGSGSTMTFTVDETKLSADNTKGLMESIRVIFMDTESKAIYGIGKLDMATSQFQMTGETVTGIEASLYLHDFSFNTSGEETKLVIGDKIDEANAVLCALNANQAKAVSVMVYLDGETVTNADVANAATSAAGALNLQFASSATLVPMENTALKEMTGEGEYNATLKVAGVAGVDPMKTTITANDTYYVSASDITSKIPSGYQLAATNPVVVTMGGKDITSTAYQNGAISISEVTGEIVVTVTLEATGG